jgi:CBS domain-containing protein
MKVNEVMTREVWTCRADDTANRAAQIMWEKDCGCAPVVDADGRLVGMITDRDVCMGAYTQGRALGEIRVADVMSKDVHSCGSDATIDYAEKLMREHRIRRIPVVDFAGRPMGLLSLDDLALEVGRAGTKKELKVEDVALTLAAVCKPRSERRTVITS